MSHVCEKKYDPGKHREVDIPAKDGIQRKFNRLLNQKTLPKRAFCHF